MHSNEVIQGDRLEINLMPHSNNFVSQSITVPITEKKFRSFCF